MKAFILILLFFNALFLSAQVTQFETVDVKQYVVTCHNGAEYIGEIIKDDGREVLMQIEVLGQIYIPKIEVKSIIELKEKENIVNKEYQPEGPFTTRYTFTTNALPIKRGENYGMINLYGPEFHVAVTDNLNVGIMSSWIASPLVLAIKYSFKTNSEKVHYSFGTLIGTSGYLNGFKGYGGLHWLNVTLGDRKNNITFSSGYSYIKTGISSFREAPGVYLYDDPNAYFGYQNDEPLGLSSGPIFSVAGIFKIGAKTSFIFDSLLGFYTHERQYTEFLANDLGYRVVRDENAHSTALLIMPGVRFQNTERKAFQISLSGISLYGDSDASFPIPMCTWFYKF